MTITEESNEFEQWIQSIHRIVDYAIRHNGEWTVEMKTSLDGIEIHICSKHRSLAMEIENVITDDA